MRTGWRVMQIVVMAAAMSLTACSDDEKKRSSSAPTKSGGTAAGVAQSYQCNFEGWEDSPVDVLILKQDGTFRISSFDSPVEGIAGTWSVSGNAGELKTDAWKETFNVANDSFNFSSRVPAYWRAHTDEYDPPPSTATAFVCIKESGQQSK